VAPRTFWARVVRYQDPVETGHGEEPTSWPGHYFYEGAGVVTLFTDSGNTYVTVDLGHSRTEADLAEHLRHEFEFESDADSDDEAEEPHSRTSQDSLTLEAAVLDQGFWPGFHTQTQLQRWRRLWADFVEGPSPQQLDARVIQASLSDDETFYLFYDCQQL